MTPATLFAELEEYVASSRAQVEAGADVDLAGLDANIEKLCNLVLSMSPDDQQLYAPRLEDLLHGLNALGLALKAQHDITQLPMHRNASVAYKTADSRDNFGRREEGEQNG